MEKISFIISIDIIFFKFLYFLNDYHKKKKKKIDFKMFIFRPIINNTKKKHLSFK